MKQDRNCLHKWVRTLLLLAIFACVLVTTRTIVYALPVQQGTEPAVEIYLSSSDNGDIGAVAFKDEDILFFDGEDWSLFVDFSDIGLTQDISAFTVLDNNAVLLAINGITSLPGIGTVTPNDVLLFTPTRVGEKTAGELSLFMQGADVGLEGDAESIDAISMAPDGRLLISTKSKALIGELAGGDEDLFAFAGTSFGGDTEGSWTMYFDGSDVGLSTSDEDIVGAWVDPSSEQLYLLTKGNFSAGSLQGDQTKIFIFTPTSLGFATGGAFEPEFYFDASPLAEQLGTLDGLAIGPQAIPEQTDSSLAAAGTINITTLTTKGHAVFGYNGDIGDFTAKNGTQRSFSRLKPGTYMITQANIPTGWQLNEISCSDPDYGSSEIGHSAIVDLDARETVNCTFVNERGSYHFPEDDGRGSIYMSIKGSVKIGDLEVSQSDILAYNPRSNTWSQIFLGEAAGLTANVNAIHVVPDSHILMSFDAEQPLPGIEEPVQPADIVLYNTAAGNFSPYFDGTAAGLVDADIDAISETKDGELIISTRGSAVVNDGTLEVKDEDLLMWDANQEEWALYLDSSVYGLETDLVALWVSGSKNSPLYLVSDKPFILENSSGDFADIIIFNGKSSTDSEAGSFGPGLFFDGSALGLKGEAIDGLTITP